MEGGYLFMTGEGMISLSMDDKRVHVMSECYDGMFPCGMG